MAAPRVRAPRYAVIMAGGSGTRFWPASRRRRPKQFLAMGGGPTLLQATAQRLRGLIPPRRVLVVTPPEFAALVRRQLPGLPRENVLIEPAPRGTAACLALAAARIAARDDAASMAAFPADHLIGDVPRFRRCVARAFAVAEREDCLVTFGIRPASAETGYGYIEVGEALRSDAPRVHWAARFVEKPGRAAAERYLTSGRHLWNSGMFVWRIPVLRAELARHAPALARVMDAFRASHGGGAAARRAYRRLPAVSIDVALMERADRIAVVTTACAWSDIGSWDAMPAVWGRDAEGNTCRGETLLIDCRNSVVYGGSRLVAVLGARDLIVVDTPGAVLVCPRERAQEVRRVVAALAGGRRRNLS
jgi:mannose-1-phosphate guanylyltransferase